MTKRFTVPIIVNFANYTPSVARETITAPTINTIVAVNLPANNLNKPLLQTPFYWLYKFISETAINVRSCQKRRGTKFKINLTQL
jgi:hypothetical protein